MASSAISILSAAHQFLSVILPLHTVMNKLLAHVLSGRQNESESIRLDGLVDTFVSIILACFHMFSSDDGAVVEFWRKCWRKRFQQ